MDIFAFTMDNLKPGTTIILISGDRDFAYAAAILRSRQFRVVVIAPMEIHPSLKVQASVLYDWQKDILKTSGTNTDLVDFFQNDAKNQSIVSPHLRFADLSVDNADSLNFSSGGNDFQQLERLVYSPRKLLDPSTSKSFPEPETSSSHNSNFFHVDETILGVDFTGQTPTVDSTFIASVPQTSYSSTLPSMVSSQPSALSATMVPETQSLKSFLTGTTSTSQPNITPPVASMNGNVPVANSSNRQAPDPAHIRKFWPLVSRLRTGKSMAWQPYLYSDPDLKRLEMDPNDYDHNFQAHVLAAQDSRLVCVREENLGDPSTARIELIDHDISGMDPAFDSLIESLRTLRRSGVDEPIWSQIGPTLGVKVYRDAGVSKLGLYLDLASKAGIVNSNSTSQCVSLKYETR